MSYQFLHIETYSEAPKRVKGTQDQYNHVLQVIGEAAREPAYSRHVAEPMMPRELTAFGAVPLSTLARQWKRFVENYQEDVVGKGGHVYQRSLRKDAATLYTEIHSHPLTSADYLAAPTVHRATLQEWVRRLLKHFKSRMPDGITFSAVIHFDEGHVHIHILVLNKTDHKMNANLLHSGKVAAMKAELGGFRETKIQGLAEPILRPFPRRPRPPRPSKNRQTQKNNDLKYASDLDEWRTASERIRRENDKAMREWNKNNKEHLRRERARRRDIRGDGRHVESPLAAYTTAMRNLQDQYYEHVGKYCGLQRLGPRKARKTTKQAFEDRKAAEHLAVQNQRIAIEQNRQDEINKQQNLMAQEFEDREQDIFVGRLELVLEKEAVDRNKLALSEMSGDVNKRALALEQGLKNRRLELETAAQEQQSAMAREYRSKRSELAEKLWEIRKQQRRKYKIICEVHDDYIEREKTKITHRECVLAARENDFDKRLHDHSARQRLAEEQMANRERDLQKQAAQVRDGMILLRQKISEIGERKKEQDDFADALDELVSAAEKGDASTDGQQWKFSGQMSPNFIRFAFEPQSELSREKSLFRRLMTTTAKMIGRIGVGMHLNPASKIIDGPSPN